MEPPPRKRARAPARPEAPPAVLYPKITDEEVKILTWLEERPRNKDNLPQTYDGEDPNLSSRHDVYDASLVSILFDMHGHHEEAGKICDGFIGLLLPDDKAAVHRLAACYTKDGSPIEAKMDAGNNAWVIIALAYHGEQLGEGGSKYADAALTLKHRLCVKQGIEPNSEVWAEGPKAVSDYHDENKDKLKLAAIEGEEGKGWCSSEHTIDLVTAARLCGDEGLLKMAQSFIDRIFSKDYEVGGCKHSLYLCGTTPDETPNYFPVPVDCQTWSLLAEADPSFGAEGFTRDQDAMRAVSKLHYTVTRGHHGTFFSHATIAFYHLHQPGAKPTNPCTGIQIENTASAALALAKHLDGDKRALPEDEGQLRVALDGMTDSLKRLVNDSGGAVPAAIERTGSGLTWDYFPAPHVASAAWTGFFLAATRGRGYHPKFNPYMPL